MNVLDATVVKVISNTWDDEYQTFRVTVIYNCWGSESETEIWRDTKDKADAIKAGDTIQV